MTMPLRRRGPRPLPLHLNLLGLRAMAVLARGAPGNAPMGALPVAKVTDAAASLLARPDPVPVGEVIL